MKIMYLDTSTQVLYINFVIDGKSVYEINSVGKNNHSDNLLKLIVDGLQKLNLEVKDFDKIVCGRGPGMYTGLRVSMTVAKMFAWTLNKELDTVSSLDLLSSGYFKEDGKYLVMMKAKKDYSYSKAFEIKNGKYNLLSKEEFGFNEDILKKYNEEYKLINNDSININVLNISDDMLDYVENIHALEPNYLRSDI